MKYKKIITGEDLLEKLEYPSKNFPVIFSEDRMDEFLNGEFNYHWHNDFEFGMIIKGKARYYIHYGNNQEECRDLAEGDGVFINSKSLHRVVQLKPGTVEFDFVFPSDLFSELPLGEIYQNNVVPILKSSLAGLFLHKNEEGDKPLLDSIKKMHRLKSYDQGYELNCLELMCRIWRQLFEKVSKMKKLPDISKAEQMQDQRMRVMLSYIHAHYKEKIPVNSVAEAASISRSECFRCFRSVIGKTPAEYIMQYRLSQAARRLINTDMTLSEICFSCGFKSMSYFGKLFRENWGVSPGQYRRKNI